MSDSKYRYRATDADGNPIFGELEASGIEAVIHDLAAEGLNADPGDVWEVGAPAVAPEPDGGRLSDEAAAEVASRIAELAECGLPLAPGLRALAGELSVARISRVLEQLADQLDAGSSLDEAIAAHGNRFPPHLRGLLLAGVATGRLPETLEQYVAFRRERSQIRHRIWASLAYPLLLLTLLLLLFLFFSVFIVPEFAKIYRDFDAELPPMTQMVLSMSGPGMRFVVCLPAFALYVLLLLSTTRVSIWGRRLLYLVPLVGPLWKLSGMAAFCRLLGLFVEQEVPLPDALRYTGEGLGEADLAVASLGAARQVRDGRSLSEALSRSGQFPPTLRAFADWGHQSGCLADALRAAGEVFERRLRLQIRLCDIILPAIMFVLVISAVLFLIMGLMMPLFSLIMKLSG